MAPVANPEVDTESDLGEVRLAINVEALETYLVSQHAEYFERPIRLKQFGYGQSNPSYQITDSKGRKYVLRKKPEGLIVSKTAHAIDREYAMLSALRNTGVPVPNVIGYCSDPKVIGTEFYIMDFVKGRIFQSPSFRGLSAKDRLECWKSAVDTIVKLHSIDPRKLSLPPAFTKNYSSHYPRQLKTLEKVSTAQAEAKDIDTGAQVGPIPHIEQLIAWMKANIPTEKVSIVHGDYKIDNLIYHPTDNKVIAILDWELCTIGHPLADVGNLLHPFSVPYNFTEISIGAFMGSPPDQLPPGLPTVQQALSWYQAGANWNPSDYWLFAKVYAHFRMAVICQGIAMRLARRQTASSTALAHAQFFPIVAGLALKEIQSSTRSSKL